MNGSDGADTVNAVEDDDPDRTDMCRSRQLS